MKIGLTCYIFRILLRPLIGYGGLPSNHSAIVSSMAALITLAFIVMLDANSLRRQVGKHAVVINKLAAGADDHKALRERMGHTRLEIAVGIVVGLVVAAAVNMILT